jgi:hypothetical protein
MAQASLQTASLWKRKREEIRRFKELPRLSGIAYVNETYIYLERHGELPVKGESFKKRTKNSRGGGRQRGYCL